MSWYDYWIPQAHKKKRDPFLESAMENLMRERESEPPTRRALTQDQMVPYVPREEPTDINIIDRDYSLNPFQGYIEEKHLADRKKRLLGDVELYKNYHMDASKPDVSFVDWGHSMNPLQSLLEEKYYKEREAKLDEEERTLAKSQIVGDYTLGTEMPLLYDLRRGHPYNRPGNEWMWDAQPLPTAKEILDDIAQGKSPIKKEPDDVLSTAAASATAVSPSMPSMPAQGFEQEMDWRDRLSAFIKTPQYEGLMDAVGALMNWGDPDYVKKIDEKEKTRAEAQKKKAEEAIKMQKDLLDIALKQEDILIKKQDYLSKKMEMEPLANKLPGTPSKDGQMVVFQDPKTGEKRWVPEKGTNLYYEKMKEVNDGMDAIVEENEIIDSMLFQLNDATELTNRYFSTGALSTLTKRISDTDATRIRSVVNSLRGMGIVQKIIELRKKYGNLFGQFTEGEHGFVAAFLGNLNPDAGPEILLRNLAKLQKVLHKAKYKMLQFGVPDSELRMNRYNMGVEAKQGQSYKKMMDYYSRPAKMFGIPIYSMKQAQQSGYRGNYIDLRDYMEYINSNDDIAAYPVIRKR